MHILEGLELTWQKPYYQRRFDWERVSRALASLRVQAPLVAPVTAVHGVAEDEEDDLVLATAVAGGVQFLVTGDRRLQELGSNGNTVVTPPRQFLDVLAETADAR